MQYSTENRGDSVTRFAIMIVEGGEEGNGRQRATKKTLHVIINE